MGSRLDSNSQLVRKRIENHTFDDEGGEEYEASAFGGFNDYFRRKKLKLQNLDAEIRSSSAGKPPIFRGVVAHVNGYTQPSLNDLHRMLVSHGGGFLQYLDGKTAATHIIASALTPKKREEFRRYRIVKPAWVVESVNTGRLLPWDNFRVIDEGISQKTLRFENGQVTSQANIRPRGYKDQTESSWYTAHLAPATTPNDGDQVQTSGTDSQHFSPSLTAQDIDILLNDDIEDMDEEAQAREDSTGPVKRTLDEVGGKTGMDEMPESAEPVSAPDEQPESPPAAPQDRSNQPVTSEEYNAQLLSDPRMKKSSVANPEFLQQFYRESRLHHLSTWKAELKAQLQAATQEKPIADRLRPKSLPGSRRYILHVDFDSFFAAVSLQKHAELIEKPVAIAHGNGSSSEIASCNYPARKFGIKNGMWMKGALQMCPELTVLPYDFPAYEEASKKFYDSVLAVDGIVQSVSIDEVLLDVTQQCLEAGGSDGRGIQEGSIWREQAKADEIAQSIRDSVKEKTNCHVSVGIGGNILLAKLALRKAKPAGQYQLKPEDILEFIGGLTVQDLPGVAHSLGNKLEDIGVKLVKDIREISKDKLISTLGPKTGLKLFEYARGIDRANVGDQVIRKSVSAEVNWGIRFVNQAQADEFVQNLCGELHRRLVENAVKGTQLTMRVMKRAADAPLEPVKHLGHGRCDTFNKSISLGVATSSQDIISKGAISMLRGFGFSPGDLRGIGVQMTKLEPVRPSTRTLDSSQKQLSFAKSPSKSKPEAIVDPDEIDSPRKGDPGSDISRFAQGAPSLNDPSLRPLNLRGTQLIMPTQVDPEVLAELPPSIRSKLVSKSTNRKLDFSGHKPQQPQRSQSPSIVTDLPPESQLDPDILEELPPDVRAEILAFYQQPSGPSNQRKSPAPNAPQSAPLSRPKMVATPPKKRRGRPPLSSKPSRPASKPHSTLTQSNFVLTRNFGAADRPADGLGDTPRSPGDDVPEDISEDFLAALPEDIRREVLEDHRRTKLQKRAALELPPAPRRRPTTQGSDTNSPPVQGQRRLVLPARPERPTFTSKKLSSLPELRGAVEAWHSSFKDEGPYEEDVEALVTYLGRVVAEEHDIEKAVSVAKWLSWLVDHNLPSSGGQSSFSASRSTWQDALDRIHRGIVEAVTSRGLPPPDFS